MDCRRETDGGRALAGGVHGAGGCLLDVLQQGMARARRHTRQEDAGLRMAAARHRSTTAPATCWPPHLEKLRLGDARITQQQHVDVAAHAVLVLYVLLQAAEHRQRQGELDVLVAIDARRDGLHDDGQDTRVLRQAVNLLAVFFCSRRASGVGGCEGGCMQEGTWGDASTRPMAAHPRANNAARSHTCDSGICGRRGSGLALNVVRLDERREHGEALQTHRPRHITTTRQCHTRPDTSGPSLGEAGWHGPVCC